MKRNFIYQLIYQILTLALPLVTTPYLARVLGPKTIGTFSYANATASFFGMFILLGIANYGNRAIAMMREDDALLQQGFWSIYRVQAVACFLVMVSYEIFLHWQQQQLLPYFHIYLLATGLDISWFFFGLEKFKLTVTRNIIVKVISTLAIFIFVKSASQVYLYALIMVLSQLVNAIYLWFYLPKVLGKNKQVCGTWKDTFFHLKGLLILFIPILAISFYTIVSKLLLNNLSSTIEVGYYDSVSTILLVPTAIVTALGTVTLPKISNLLAKNNQREADSLFYKSLFFSLVVVMPITFGIMAVADTFVPLFYGPGYDTVATLIPIMLPSCIFLVIGTVVRTQYLIPHQKNRVYIESVCLAAVVSLVSNWLLVPFFGSRGAGFALLFAQGAVSFWQVWRIRRELRWELLGWDTIVILLIGLLMYIVVKATPTGTGWLGLALSILLGGAVYLPCIGLYVVKRWKNNIVNQF